MIEKLRRLRWKRILADLAVAAAIVAAITAWQGRNLKEAGASPALSGTTLDGEAFDLASLRGEKAIVFFWAPWCGVCKVEMPTLNALAEDGVRVVGVVQAYRDVAEVERFASEHGLRFPVVLGDEASAADWSVDVYPTLYIIDEAGRIEHALVGYTTGIGLRLRLL